MYPYMCAKFQFKKTEEVENVNISTMHNFLIIYGLNFSRLLKFVKTPDSEGDSDD